MKEEKQTSYNSFEDLSKEEPEYSYVDLEYGDIVQVKVRVYGIVSKDKEEILLLSGQSIKIKHNIDNIVKIGNKKDHEEDYQYFNSDSEIKAIQYTGDVVEVNRFSENFVGYQFIDWNTSPMNEGEWLVVYEPKNRNRFPAVIPDKLFKEKFKE
jgi:hypothetical protein